MSNKRGFIDGEYQDGELRGLAFLVGQRGMGKTTEMARLLAACSGGVVFFDSLSKHDAVLPNYVKVSQPGEMKTYLRRYSRKRFRLLYQPRSGNLDAHFQACCEIVKAFGSMIFGIDELDKLCGDRFGSSRMPVGLYELVNYGRHHRVSMLATARIPIQVPRGYTSECGEMRLFHMHENRYVKYFAEFIGEADSSRLRTLDKYQFIHWTGDADPAQVLGGRQVTLSL